MLTPKASAPLQLVPPPTRSKPRRGVRMGKVQVGANYVPGTVVRHPERGLFYEVSWPGRDRDADWLQAILLRHTEPRQVAIPCDTTQRRINTVIEFFDCAWFRFASLFGVQR
jgi:hypothetical protein